MFENNSIKHILFLCEINKEVRKDKCDKILENSPEGLKRVLCKMIESDRVFFLLNAMNCYYVKEWENTYHYILEFIYYVYNAWCTCT